MGVAYRDDNAPTWNVMGYMHSCMHISFTSQDFRNGTTGRDHDSRSSMTKAISCVWLSLLLSLLRKREILVMTTHRWLRLGAGYYLASSGLDSGCVSFRPADLDLVSDFASVSK
jgi:hypothetical protein